MTKRDLVVKIAKETKLIQNDVAEVVQMTLDYVADELAGRCHDGLAGGLSDQATNPLPLRSVCGLPGRLGAAVGMSAVGQPGNPLYRSPGDRPGRFSGPQPQRRSWRGAAQFLRIRVGPVPSPDPDASRSPGPGPQSVAHPYPPGPAAGPETRHLPPSV